MIQAKLTVQIVTPSVWTYVLPLIQANSTGNQIKLFVTYLEATNVSGNAKQSTV